MSLLLLSPLGFLALSEIRFRAAEREWKALAQNLVARRVTRAEAKAALSRIGNSRVHDGPEAAVVAEDSRMFGFVFSFAYVKTLIFFDAGGRAKSHRIEHDGKAL